MCFSRHSKRIFPANSRETSHKGLQKLHGSCKISAPATRQIPRNTQDHEHLRRSVHRFEPHSHRPHKWPYGPRQDRSLPVPAKQRVFQHVRSSNLNPGCHVLSSWTQKHQPLDRVRHCQDLHFPAHLRWPPKIRPSDFQLRFKQP